jgi:HK97 family phage prohead protease
MKKRTFILSDQSVNSYGFVVLTSGIDLEFFKKNPVMLFNHKSEDIIGKWENVRIEDGKLVADASFDEDDDRVKGLMRKVDKGMLNGTSIGFDIIEMKLDGTKDYDCPVVIECSLREASLTAVPSNSNALRLYKDGVLLTSEQVSVMLDRNKNQNLSEMKKLQFFVVALTSAGVKLPTEPTEEDILKGVQQVCGEHATLTSDKADLTTKLGAATQKEADAKKTSIKTMLDAAQAAGKFTADNRPKFEKLADADLEATKAALDAIPARKTLSEQTSAGAPPAGAVDYSTWGLKKLHKEAPEELARIKANEPERYKQLLAENK